MLCVLCADNKQNIQRYFVVLLNYLRRGELILDDGVSPVGVLVEARHFNLMSIVNMLHGSSSTHNWDSTAAFNNSNHGNNTATGEDNLTWEDIGGLTGVKKELQQVSICNLDRDTSVSIHISLVTASPLI